jgi:hypothetical protein
MQTYVFQLFVIENKFYYKLNVKTTFFSSERLSWLCHVLRKDAASGRRGFMYVMLAAFVGLSVKGISSDQRITCMK